MPRSPRSPKRNRKSLRKLASHKRASLVFRDLKRAEAVYDVDIAENATSGSEKFVVDEFEIFNASGNREDHLWPA